MKKRNQWFNGRTATCIVASALVFSSARFAFDAPIGLAQGIDSDNAMTRVVVEMDGAPAIQTLPKSVRIGAASKSAVSKMKERTESIKLAHGKVLQTINEKGIPFKESNEYTFTFNGISMKVPKNKLDELRSIPGVKAVYPDQEYHTDLAESVPLIGAPDVWSMHDQENQGVTGKGVTVAVIDTGVDYNHPDLGGAIGPGHKVLGGYDFVNHDNDPMDDYGHGTHVAGIIGAHGKVTGVAPDASITAYKVMDNNGSGDTSDILAGIEASISPDNPYPADVINMSLSGPGDGSDPISQAAQNAVEAGVVVVAAAGNSGPGYGTIGAPAMAEGVLAVGASTSGIKVPVAKMVAPVEENLSVTRLGFTANPPEAATTRELVDVGEGGLENYEGVDVKGKIALIQLPQGASVQQAFSEAVTAQEKGADAALFYLPDQPGPVFKLGDTIPSQYTSNSSEKLQAQDQFQTDSSWDGRLDTLAAMLITGTKAGELKSYLAKGPVKITIAGKDATDQIANFSSRGNSDLRAKPDLVAPGVEINSTYIKKQDDDSGYTRMSGTSMAAPHVAGAAALIKQLHPSWKASEIASILKESAKPLASYDVLTQGAGRLDVKAAAETNVVASPNGLNFGIADLKDSEIHRSASLSLNNHGEKPVDMDFTVKDATKSGAAVTVNPSHIHIEPGQQVNVDVNINMNRPDQDMVISGWIEGNIQSGTESQHLQEPYQLTVRHLQITASPDPVASTVNETEAFIYSPVDLSQAPKVTVRTPSGKTTQVTSVLDHDHWWRVPVQTSEVGIYQIDASSTVKNSSSEESTIIGSGYVEKLPADKEHSSSWKAVGPYSNAGLMHIDPKNPKVMTVLSTQSPSIFRTEDGAKTWHEFRNFPVAGGVPTAIVVDPTNEKNIYVPVKSRYNDPTYIGKIFASKDAGITWNTLPFPNIEVSDLVIDESGQKLVAISSNEVFVSLDKGMNWEKLSGNWPYLNKAHLLNNDLYLSAGYNGVYAVKDVFSGSATSVKLFQPRFRGIQDVVGNQDILIASTYGGGLYASYNQGKDWNEVTHNQVPFHDVFCVKILDGGIYVGTGYDGIWVSHDYGKTWESWKQPLPGSRSLDIDFALGAKSSPNGNRPVYVSSDQAGIYETQDKGETYKRVGIPGATVYDLAISRNTQGYQLLAGTDANTYRTMLPDQNNVASATLEWGAAQGEGMTGEQVYQVATSPTEANVVYKTRFSAIGTMNVYRSKDGGENWDLKFEDSSVPLALLVHPANPNEIVIPYNIPGTDVKGVWVSQDGGDNWKNMKQEHQFTAIAGDPKDPNRIWAGGNDGLFLSQDMGQSFQKIQNVPVSSIAINSHNPDHLVVGGNHLYVSTDGGKTLEKAKYAESELNIYVNDIIVSPTNPKVVYAATGAFYQGGQGGLLKGGRGVLMSVDGGETWTNISDGLDNKNATALELSPDEEYLFVGTQGGSVHRLKVSNNHR